MNKFTTAVVLALVAFNTTAQDRFPSHAPSILEINAHIDGIHRRAEQLQLQRENQRTLESIERLEKEQLEIQKEQLENDLDEPASE